LLRKFIRSPGEDWRKLHNEELHNSYSSPNIIKLERSSEGECNTNGGEQECIYDIGVEARRKEPTRKTKT
jgi:hypothetical protein